MQNSDAESVERKTKPIPKPRKQNKGKDEQEHGADSHTALYSNTLFDSKRVLVTGLNEKTTSDALLNYIEITSHKEVDANPTFLGHGRAVVDMKEPPDFEELKTNVQNRKLDERQLSVERINVCDSILVSGLSREVTRDTILNYFDNQRRSGAGNVEDVDLSKDTQSAIVVFKQFEVVDNVVIREHILEGKQLLVEKYYPQFSSRPQTTTIISSPHMTSRSHVTTERTRIQEEPEIPKLEREMTDVRVDADIMQFIMDSAHVDKLESKLGKELKAEFEWEPGSETVTILKKVDAGYVKKWEKSCGTAVCKFLDQFDKFSIPLGSVALMSVINEVLPRLEEKLSKGKALCKSDQKKQNLVVVCIEHDRRDVETCVKNFLEIVEKEEARKAFIEDKIEGVSKMRMAFLRHIGFVGEMKRKSTELEVDTKTEEQEIYLVGPVDQVKNFKKEYFRLMGGISEHPFELPSDVGPIFTNRTDYFQEKLAANSIIAMFFPEGKNLLRIVAKSFADHQKAKECLLGSLKQERVSLEAENAFIFKSKKFIELVNDLQNSQLVNINVDKSGCSVVLYGAFEAVESFKRKIDDFIDMKRIGSKTFEIPKSQASFLKGKLGMQKLKGIEEAMGKYHVSISVHQRSVEIKGTHKGLVGSAERFHELRKTIVEETKTFAKPGLGELIRGENGQRNLKMIEVEKEVVIEICKDRHSETKDKIEDGLPNRDEKEPLEAVPRSDNTGQHPHFDKCNFITNEGVHVSWAYGNLETVNADILVNSANPNLNNPTACGHALINVGGEAFMSACQEFTSINSGDIVCTPSGNLPCDYVIHAVCGDWDGEGGNAEKELRGVVRKIFSKSIELRASSLAMPVIGAGGHRFPERVVFQVYREEIKKFSNHNPQACLKRIGIIVFKKPTASSGYSPGPKQMPSANLSHGLTVPTQVPQLSTGTVYDVFCNFTTTQGTKVTWKYGNIERESADVLVSSANSDLNSPTVCGKAINAIGGQSFVQACKPYNSIGEGNIACTAAGGNLSCKNVFHAVCSDWKKGNGDKILRGLVNKILSKCAELQATSLALPIIGTGQHKFPEKVVLQIYKDEIENFSARTSPLSLKHIHVVVFSAKRPANPSPSQPMTNPPSASVPAAAGRASVVSFGQVRVSLHEGDITRQPPQSDALLNILPPDLKLANGGGVCSGIRQSGGQAIQNELDAFGTVPLGTIVKTSGGTMMAAGLKKIIHAIPVTNNVPGLLNSVGKCLDETKAESLRSVSIPALGTASFNVSAKDSADLILKAAKNFSSLNYPLTINIVVFQKNMMLDFESKIYEYVNGNTTGLTSATQPPTPVTPLNPPNQTATPSSQPSTSQSQAATPPSQSTPAPNNVGASNIPKPPESVDYKSLKIVEATEVIHLMFIGSSRSRIEESIQEVQKYINNHTVVKTIKHQKLCDVLSKNWSEIQKLAREYQVNIVCESSNKVAFEGLASKVFDCKEKVQDFIQTNMEEEQRVSAEKDEQNMTEYFSMVAKWSYLQGNQSVDYGKKENATLERTFMKEDCYISMNAQTYDVDFTAMTLKNQSNGQVIKIERKQLGLGNTTNISDIPLPSHWSPQPQGKLIFLVLLPTSSTEYQTVLNRFTSTGGSGNQVITIERVQNPKLYKAFAAMKQTMPTPNEMQLFHGTAAVNTAKINQNGFNRIFAGINGVALGNGIYFAKNASTSLGFSRKGGSGPFKMYYAKVLAGDFSQGANGIKTPPKKNDPSNPELLYDSTVNDVRNPSVFVTFLDPQCYPEYVITFK